MNQETKAQRIERIKREKDGLDVLDSIYRYARTGEEIDPEDLDRLKWYGLYTQNRVAQDDNDPTQYYMLRVRLPNGRLSSYQAIVLGEISVQYARHSADATTRQDIQFHWIRFKDLPEIFHRLESAGLSVVQASGDCPRNIVTCPLNGLDANQIDDVRDLLARLNALYLSNREFSNLPRKFKVGLCGCSRHCIGHEVQDLAFTASKTDDGGVRFCVSVGGGQASNRRIADMIGSVRREEVIPLAEAVARIYRDHGRRDNRSKARLGHLIEAWGVERFVRELETLSQITLEPYEAQPFTPYPQRNHFGVSPTIVYGMHTVGCALYSGRFGGEMLIRLGRMMELYGIGEIALTPTQNFVLLGVHSDTVEALLESLNAAGFRPHPGAFEARTLACTGLEYCKFALSETKSLAISVVGYLNRTFADFDEPISISINGCPNACAHPHIVDLGFVGAMVKKGTERIAGFELLVGGWLEGERSRFGIRTGIKLAPNEIAPYLETLINEYRQGEHERFRSYLLEKFNHEPALSPPAGEGG